MLPRTPLRLPFVGGSQAGRAGDARDKGSDPVRIHTIAAAATARYIYIYIYISIYIHDVGTTYTSSFA